MALIFVALSFMSFLDSRGQVVPTGVEYAGHDAVEGKRIFQAYNCMGCHTIVGNGAYFGPDLTKLYGHVGPAWLEAFLPSAGRWPTQTAVQVQLQKPMVSAEANVESLEAYFDKYPAAAERVNRRSGHATIMPNLPFRAGEIAKLIAFLKYTSEMDTEGWPPVPQVAGLTFPQATPMPAAASTLVVATAPASGAADLDDPVALGSRLVEDNGCTACHSTGVETLVGPAWGGLYNNETTLADGSRVTVDDAYLSRAIMNPDAQVAAGFEAGVMPSYAEILNTDEVKAIVAYIRSLGGEGQ
jgi:mono/diheme cytochrome c family protein